jgi:hypothetical protein
MIQAVYPRYPNKRHWNLLSELDSHTLEPEEFLRHWEVSHSDLARICKCSVPTVDRWFSKGKNHREPSEQHKRRLAITHRLWSKAEKVS